MIESDFYDLKVDQLIWYQGKKFVIDSLTRSRWSGKKTISIYGNLTDGESHKNYDYYFEDICADCSLEAPKEKKLKRFWQWKLKSSAKGPWYRSDMYMDENGCYSNGETYSNDWDNYDKEKIDSDFTDVEVE